MNTGDWMGIAICGFVCPILIGLSIIYIFDLEGPVAKVIFGICILFAFVSPIISIWQMNLIQRECPSGEYFNYADECVPKIENNQKCKGNYTCKSEYCKDDKCHVNPNTCTDDEKYDYTDYNCKPK